MRSWSGYAEALKEQEEFRKQQEQLHSKYEDIEDYKVIVETTNSYKFTINIIKNTLKIASEVTLIILASIGTITLLYPSIRVEFFNVIAGILGELKNMI